MKKDVAAKINTFMLAYGAELDHSVKLVTDTASAEEFEAYRAAIAKIMGTMLVDIMNPIYKEHPDLKPPELED